MAGGKAIDEAFPADPTENGAAGEIAEGFEDHEWARPDLEEE